MSVKQYDQIKVKVDNLMTQDRSLGNEHEFPNKEVKDVENLVNRLTVWTEGNDRDK